MRGFDDVPDGRARFHVAKRLSMLIFGTIVLLSGFVAIFGRMYLTHLRYSNVSDPLPHLHVGQGTFVVL